MKLWAVLAILLINAGDSLAGERIVFADQKLSVVLPDGWKKSELNKDKTMTGWESPDQTSSVFFQEMNANLGITMDQLMDNIVDRYDDTKGLIVKRFDPYKSGQVNGVGMKFPAIYTRLDITLQGSPKDFELKYYLFVFDAGDTQYFIQGSTTKPIWDVRERQIMALIRSLIARK